MDYKGLYMVYNGVYIYIHDLVGSFSSTPLKNDGVKVIWDDDTPNI